MGLREKEIFTKSQKSRWSVTSYNYSVGHFKDMVPQVTSLSSSYSPISCQCALECALPRTSGQGKTWEILLQDQPSQNRVEWGTGWEWIWKQTSNLTEPSFEDTLCKIWTGIHVTLLMEKFLPIVDNPFIWILSVTRQKNLSIICLLTLKTMKQNALHKVRRGRFKYIIFLNTK